VTIRISTRRDGPREVVAVDGRLDADVVPELERVIAELSAPVCMDLAGLKSADEAGLGVLRALLAHGVAVTGASPYFRLLLELEKPGQARKLPSGRGGRKRDGGSGQGAT
jgi:anti-anti-sigma regulatory factor